MNNNCRQNKLQRLILFERKRVNQPWVEPYKLLVNEACRHFCGTFCVKSSPIRRWQSHYNTLDRSYKYRFLNELGNKVQSYIKPLKKVCAKHVILRELATEEYLNIHVILRSEVTKNPFIPMSFWGLKPEESHVWDPSLRSGWQILVKSNNNTSFWGVQRRRISC